MSSVPRGFSASPPPPLSVADVDINDYPTTDGRPMAETDQHRNVMFDCIEALKLFYAGQHVYVSGNLLLFYEEGNKRKHISPDVLVTKGLDMRERVNYRVWVEGLSPHVVFEITSSSTRSKDVKTKKALYQDVLRVREYFLFDPFGDYLKPPLQGLRLEKGEYVPIDPLQGRLPSQELGLHLERQGERLRLFNPATGSWLLTPREQAEEERARRREAEAQRREAEARERKAAEENARLRAEIEQLRRGQQ